RLAAPAHRAPLWRALRRRRRPGAGDRHHRLVGRIPARVPGPVRAGRPGRVRQSGLSALSPYPQGARLRAGADRDQRGDALGARPGGAARGAPRAAARRRAGGEPANPTGTMMTGAALGDLIAAAEAAGIRFISDEIYHGLDYAFPAVTAAQLSGSAVVINS